METSEHYYSRTWEEASLAYKERGFYKWCIDQIPVGTHILEIGTGIGIATLDLLEAGFIVSSLEENSHCFEKARKRLIDAGKSINVFSSINQAHQCFGENNLIKSNFITEWDVVVNAIKYDTVVCWFVGVHQLAHKNPDLIKIGYSRRDFGHYRYLIYNRIFQVISLRLPVGGVISLIERVGVPSTDQISEEHDSFSKDYELESYGLRLDKIEQFPIGNISSVPGIKMCPVKESTIAVGEENTDAALIAYTIVRFREADLSDY